MHRDQVPFDLNVMCIILSAFFTLLLERRFDLSLYILLLRHSALSCFLILISFSWKIMLRIFSQVCSAGSCTFNPGREQSGVLQMYSDGQWSGRWPGQLISAPQHSHRLQNTTVARRSALHKVTHDLNCRSQGPASYIGLQTL